MDDLLSEGTQLVRRYGTYVQDKNLDAIVNALTEDCYIEFLNRPPMAGKKHIAEYYRESFAQGDYRFDVDITDSKEVAEVVFVNGTMKRIHTPTGALAETMTILFSFVLKKENGELKIWHCRTAR